MAIPGVRFKAVSPRPNFMDKGRVNRAIRQGLEKECAPQLKSYFTRIVAPWSAEHRPDFETKVEGEETKGYVLSCKPVGDNAKYWLWTSRGTKKHKIIAKNAPALIFRLGYQPHTSGGGHYNGPGIATGEWRSVKPPKVVEHPGTKPRYFEEAIARWYAPVFRRTMEAIIKNAIAQGVGK